MNNTNYLQHYGILGMKWGKRKGASLFSKSAKAEKQGEREEKKKRKDLSSPTRLYKNRHKYTQSEIDSAMKKMKWERELRNLSRDELTTGAQYANALLGYATAASSAYGLYKSPLGQVVADKLKKK